MQQVYVTQSKMINEAGSIRCKYSSVNMLYTVITVGKNYTWALTSNVWTACDVIIRNIFRFYLTCIYIKGSLPSFSFLITISSLNVLTSALLVSEKANIFPKWIEPFWKRKPISMYFGKLSYWLLWVLAT